VDLRSGLRQVLDGKTARVLAEELGLHTVGDLLHHYPRRYQERDELTDLSALRIGDHVTFFAEVHRVSDRQLRPKLHKTDVVVSDGRRPVTLTFFKRYKEGRLRPGRRAYFSGTVGEFNGARQLRNPDFQLVDDEAGQVAAEFQGGLMAIYPATAKLSTFTVRRSVRLALDQLDPLADPLPGDLRRRHRLVDVMTALHDVHQPASSSAAYVAQHRLKWDEALALQVTLAQRRLAAGNPATPRPVRAGRLLDAFDDRLPFVLTGGQQEVGALLTEELAGRRPLHRLLQGEVGSGKTVVALRAMLQVIDAGGQAALLAPTEVLAAQHARSLRDLLGPLARAGELDAADRSTRIALLTGSQSARARRTALLQIASGEAGIAIGTHALLQNVVQFCDLGLVVIDEQHRFGVEQRDTLRAKATSPPHVLVMTATPIPRTVAMTVYGDLDTSSLRELPAGRQPITSTVVPARERPAWLDRGWERVTEEAGKGHQAFVVCPRITAADEPAPDEPAPDEPAHGESDDGDRGDGDRGDGGQGRRPPMAVEDVYPMLRDGPLADLRLGMLHGRLPPEDKDAVMARFAAGDIDVLVATTVIEVGVDVPNATVMVVLDADRFGVSQLHQLRGRIGRGSAPGLCLLVTDAPPGTPARERLDAVAQSNDGFALARLDLEQRREGDVLGAAQSGTRRQLRLLSLLRDEKLITEAREEATALVATDPALAGQPALAAAVAGLVADEQAEYLDKA